MCPTEGYVLLDDHRLWFDSKGIKEHRSRRRFTLKIKTKRKMAVKKESWEKEAGEARLKTKR